MATKMELSLDDIITQTKKTGGGGRRGGFRGRGRGGGRGGLARTTAGGGGGFTSSPRRGGIRNAGAFRPRSGNPDGVWSHDKFAEAGGLRRSGGLRTAGGGVSATSGAKITISNLHFGVTDADIIELFGELGAIRYASVHYDRSGRSMGKADVLFERRTSAQQAISQYNGVPLDGRAMDISWANVVPAAVPAPRTSLNRVSGGRVARSGGGGARGAAAGGVKGTRGGVRGARGGGRGRGGRGGRTQTKTPTAEELDAELDAYVSEKAQ